MMLENLSLARLDFLWGIMFTGSLTTKIRRAPVSSHLLGSSINKVGRPLLQRISERSIRQELE